MDSTQLRETKATSPTNLGPIQLIAFATWFHWFVSRFDLFLFEINGKWDGNRLEGWTESSAYAPASFVASLNFFPHEGQEKCLMCSAGPRPSLGCISHSFAGPVTSPPHLRHFTIRFTSSHVGGRTVGMGCV